MRRNAWLIPVYLIILVGLILVGLLMDRQENSQETFGSLEGRFQSEITLMDEGQIRYYRENEITNYLLIGIDQEEVDGKDHQSGGQADFLLVLSVDRRNRTVTPVMIDRDTMTPVATYGIFGNPAGKRTMQICLAQAFSGTNVSGGRNTAKAVSGLLKGVRIDRCMVMDLGGITLLNEAVGGVEVVVEDDLTVLDPSLAKGARVILQGDLAEQFVRGRTTLADGTNAARMRRQRVYLEALTDRLSRMIDEDEETLERVLMSIDEHIETDIDQKIILNEADAFSAYQWNELKTIPGSHCVGEDGFTEFWPDEQAMQTMIVDVWFK